MNTIIKKFRKFMLKRAIEKCQFKLMKLDFMTDRYHKIIIKKIIKGEDKLEIEKLKFKRDRAYDKKSELIDLEWRFRSKLRRA